MLAGVIQDLIDTLEILQWTMLLESCFVRLIFPGWPRFSSVRLRLLSGTVRAAPVFGSSGSSLERVSFLFNIVLSERGRFWFCFGSRKKRFQWFWSSDIPPFSSFACPSHMLNQKNLRRLWRSWRRKSRSVPEGSGLIFEQPFSCWKCPNLGRDSVSCCRGICE